MIDSSRVLQPLRDVEDAIRRLDEYRGTAELARAVDTTWQAVERSLRLLLRGDRDAPDELRLAALSPDEIPIDRLIEAVRQRELISLTLAGTAHELQRSAERAANGQVRAADADLARRVVERLRAEIETAAAQSPPEPLMASAGATAETAPPSAVESRGRPLAFVAAGIAVLALATLVTAIMLSFDDGMDDAVAAFGAGRLDVAEARFQEVLRERPRNVTARLYLARIYRRDGELGHAADELEAAARLAPDDPAVRRELGYLFLELDNPQAAVGQFRRALELEPGSTPGWIGLIRALRAAGDPGAEEVLRRAPEEVRAALDRQR